MSETSQYRPRRDASVRKRTKVCYFFCLKCPKPNGTVQEQTRSSANGSKCPKPDGIVQKHTIFRNQKHKKSTSGRYRQFAFTCVSFHMFPCDLGLLRPFFLARRTSVILCGKRRQVRGEREVRVARGKSNSRSPRACLRSPTKRMKISPFCRL